MKRPEGRSSSFGADGPGSGVLISAMARPRRPRLPQRPPARPNKNPKSCDFGCVGHIANKRVGRSAARHAHDASFSHPDYTVGVGLAGLPAHRTPASMAAGSRAYRSQRNGSPPVGNCAAQITFGAHPAPKVIVRNLQLCVLVYAVNGRGSSDSTSNRRAGSGVSARVGASCWALASAT